MEKFIMSYLLLQTGSVAVLGMLMIYTDWLSATVSGAVLTDLFAVGGLFNGWDLFKELTCIGEDPWSYIRHGAAFGRYNMV